MSRYSSSDFARIIGPVAIRVFNCQPNKTLSSKTELRFGSRGAFSVNLTKGTWCDHSDGDRGGGVLDLLKVKLGLEKPAAMQWLRDNRFLAAPSNKINIVATYDYTDATGNLLFQVCRLDPKNFRQRRPDSSAPSGWVWKTSGMKLTIYHLPEVIEAVKNNDTVYIAEGEKAVDALRKLDLSATCSPGGAGKWRTDYNEYLRGADVVLLPDNDKPGRAHVADIARKLLGIASRICIVTLPGLPDKGDAFDWITADGTRAALEHLAGLAPEFSSDGRQDSPGMDDWDHLKDIPFDDHQGDKTAGNGKSAYSQNARPTLTIMPGEIDILATESEHALKSSRLPVFQRGASIVMPVAHEVPAAHGRMTLAAGLKELSAPGLVDHLAQAAIFEHWDARSKKNTRCNPPSNVASIILSRAGSWTLPSVAGVITTPTLRPDFSVLIEKGYDPATRLYHLPDRTLCMPEIKRKPTRPEAEAALALLNGLLVDFPFAASVDRAVAISGLITPVLRGMLPVAPLHAVRASTAGTGKSFLVDLAAAISTGRACPVLAVGEKDEETEKRLIGVLLSAFPIVSIDNVNGELGGEVFCQAIERRSVRVRALGASEITEIESRATFFATGNWLRVRGDMTRRTIICTLDANVERPELRTFSQDPLKQVLDNRGAFVAAALTIVKAYQTAGQPDRITPAIASFRDWSDTVRSALVWLGCADPAASMETARDEDPELSLSRQVMSAWHRVFDDTPVATRDLIEKASERFQDVNGKEAPVHPELNDALYTIAGERGGFNSKRLSAWMRGKQGRIVKIQENSGEGKNLRFNKHGEVGGCAVWKMIQVL